MGATFFIIILDVGIERLVWRELQLYIWLLLLTVVVMLIERGAVYLRSPAVPRELLQLDGVETFESELVDEQLLVDGREELAVDVLGAESLHVSVEVQPAQTLQHLGHGQLA